MMTYMELLWEAMNNFWDGYVLGILTVSIVILTCLWICEIHDRNVDKHKQERARKLAAQKATMRLKPIDRQEYINSNDHFLEDQ